MPDPDNIAKLVAETERPIRRISPDVVARSALIKRNGMTGRSPFQAPSFPPAVEAALQRNNIPTIAQDETISGTFGWASRDFVATAYAEGVVFMGYAYLATLSQRPEYRVVTEVIATEMTREWIELKAASGDESKAKKIKQIEDVMDNLGVRKAFQKVTESDGFFGRGHLYLDTGVTADDEELRMDLGDGRNLLSKQKVGSDKSGKRQRLLRLIPVEATWCYPTRYDSVDPLSPDWYNPITWFCMSREVHKSRLLTFIGRELPDILKPAYAFGGLSMSQMLKPYVDNWLRTRQSVSDLIQNFSTSVLATNMDATTSVGGDQLFARVALFNNVKQNQGCMMIDKDAEQFQNVSAPLGGLDALQAQCLPAETLVQTNRGQVPICEVKVTDKVMTRQGWVPLVWSGVTGYVPELIELQTSSGSTLRATSWHPIWLPETNEFVNAENVKVGDCLLEGKIWSTSMVNPLRGVDIGGALRERVTTATSKLAAYCTGLFGKLIEALSQPDLMCTTRTKIVPTTSYQTLNSLPVQSTTPFIMRASGGFAMRTSLRIDACVPPVDRNTKRFIRRCSIVAGNVMKELLTQTVSGCGKDLRTILLYARNVAENLLLRLRIRDYIAAQNAQTRFTTVIASRNMVLDEAVPVYNLEVAAGYLHEFYANGILVHNSQEHMASISRVPIVKLLGIQPAGLNASSEGELQSWEDWVAAFQEVLYRPHLTKILDFIQLSEFDEVDQDITFDFKPLRQEKPIEMDQRQQVIAATREVYFSMGAVDPQEVREALAQDPETPFDGVDLNKELPQPPMPPMPSGAPGAPLGAGPPKGGPTGAAPAPKPPAPLTAPKAPMPRSSSTEGDAGGSFGQKLVVALNDADNPGFAHRLVASLNEHDHGAQDEGFIEEQHPRAGECAKAGQFVKKGEGGGGGAAKTRPFEQDIPAPPIVEAPKIQQEKGAYKQKHLDALYNLAKAGKWDEIEKYPTSGTNIYAKAVERYKAQLIKIGKENSRLTT